MERKLIKTEDEFNRMVHYLSNFKKISFDTENTDLNPKFLKPVGFSLCVKDFEKYKAFYIPINHTDTKTELHKRFNEIVKGKELIIMHNSVYDSGVVQHNYCNSLLDYKWFDTMIAQHLLDENGRKGLKYLSEKYFGYKQETFAETIGSKINCSEISSERIYKYACDDAIMTYKLYELQEPQLKKEGLDMLFYKIEMPFQKTLMYIRSQGITFDKELSINVEKQLKEDKLKAVNEIIKSSKAISTITDLFGNKKLSVNIDSSKELTKLLYDKLNLPVIVTTESGKPATDNKSLEKMKDEEGKFIHPIIEPLLWYKEVEKLISTYTDSLRTKVMSDGKIYADLNDIGTATGRMSCNSPNFQNLPKNNKYPIRAFFKASEGYKMFVPDFSQEELKVCGVITNSKAFKDAFLNDEDLHLKVANGCYDLGIPEEALLKSSELYKEYEEKFHKQRFNAKFINFGIIYGMSEFGLSTMLGCTVPEAKEIIDNYFDKFPEVKREIEITKKKVKENGFIRNLYGRKRRLFKSENSKGGRYWKPKVFKQAFNFQIQGSCADILRVIMNKLYKYILKTNDEVRMLATVHDEIMFEIKDNNNFNKHKEQIIYIMENTVNLSIKLTVDGSVGTNYLEAK